MKFVTYDAGEGPVVGAIVVSGILDLGAEAARQGTEAPTSMQSLIEGGRTSLDQVQQLVDGYDPANCRNRDSVHLLSPLPRPVRFRDCCLFLEHLEKSFGLISQKLDPEYRQQVVYYNGDNVHVFGDNDVINWPSNSHEMDYELEWAIVIGEGGADIPRERARDHIFGYTILNDWSARDVQIPFMRCGLGPAAGKDFANSFGPCIVTPDEFDNPYNLEMTARVNGKLWSQGNTASMHWNFEDAIAKLSVDRPLVPGEILGSGTVLDGCGFELGRRLRDGDRVELSVEGIGTLTNLVRMYSAQNDDAHHES